MAVIFDGATNFDTALRASYKEDSGNGWSSFAEARIWFRGLQFLIQRIGMFGKAVKIRHCPATVSTLVCVLFF